MLRKCSLLSVSVLRIVWILLLGVGQVWCNLHLGYLVPAFVEPPPSAEGRVSVPVFKMMTLGHWPAGVDWLWMKSLMDPSLAHVSPGTHASMFYDLDLAADLDPKYFELFSVGASILAVIRNDGTGARDLLLKGDRFRTQELQQLPLAFRDRFWSREWYFLMMMGYVYLYELEDLPNASIAFGRAGQLPGAPPYLVSLSQRLQHPEGPYEVGVRLMDFLQTTTDDEVLKAKYRVKRDSLYLSLHLFHIRNAFQEYLNKKERYRSSPSVPHSLLSQYWKQFLSETRTSEQDPFGGKVYLAADGRVLTTTPHEKAYGLE